MTRTETRPVELYAASILGAAFAAFVALIGISQQNPVVIGHSMIGLVLYACLAFTTPAILQSRSRGWWIILAIGAAFVVAVAGGLTSLLGYTPALVALLIGGIRLRG